MNQFLNSATSNAPMLSDEEELKNFLLDIDCLDRLDEWTSPFNIFDILKISRVEIRHSNLLAWLLNPCENHGLNENVLKSLAQYSIAAQATPENDIFSTLLMDFRSFNVLREYHHIDFLPFPKKNNT